VNKSSPAAVFSANADVACIPEYPIIAIPNSSIYYFECASRACAFAFLPLMNWSYDFCLDIPCGYESQSESVTFAVKRCVSFMFF
jgi:hypothetical protein